VLEVWNWNSVQMHLTVKPTLFPYMKLKVVTTQPEEQMAFSLGPSQVRLKCKVRAFSIPGHI
jgi:hypothetical protein